jgi:hypothetical protein
MAAEVPAGQYSHWPEQLEVVSPGDDPHCPAGHSEHVPAPPVEYWPAEQTEAVAVVDPTGQAYPAAQAPLQALELEPPVPYRPAGHCAQHADDVAPALPYTPAAHSPEQAGSARPVVDPYVPAGHSVHSTEPESDANLPTGHGPAHVRHVYPIPGP